jgi:3-oxoacyl-[acyl-carrier protein] reductase
VRPGRYPITDRFTKERTVEHKTALITGGAKGIGRAIALALADRGWSIAVCYRNSEQHANTLCATLERKGSQALAARADVSNPTAASDLVRWVEGQWGRIDALINCVGPYHKVNLLDETIEGWHAMLDNNLHPVFYTCRAVAPGMKARKWGRIVNFGMANADQHSAQPLVTAHYIAKSAVLTLTRSFARALAPYGVTVNAISPGFIDSGSAPSEELSKMVKNIPAGYVGGTEDAASIVTYLLSDDAHYINGTNIHLSGAWGV